MRTVVLLSLFAATVLAAPSTREGCPEDCVLPACRCPSTDIPAGLKAEEIPQLVMITFDDAVTVTNIEFYREALDGRTNPDGCPAAATFFVQHEYNDYTLVHELWSKGHEIGLHSISHNYDANYWKTASVEQLTEEFDGQRTIINKFGNIPLDDISGIRTPTLGTASDNLFEMMSEKDFLYDCSWPTQSFIEPGLWPYSLDVPSDEYCSITPCTTKSHPGVWLAPMLDWTDDNGQICAMVDACVNISKEVDELVEFMKRNFNRQYLGNKAPFGFFVSAAWFNVNKNHFTAFKNFLDYLQTLPDVYIVNIERVIEWVKRPVTLDEIEDSNWSATCNPVRTPNCSKKTCELKKEGSEWAIWMTSCATTCPAVYPWLGNPTGSKV